MFLKVGGPLAVVILTKGSLSRYITWLEKRLKTLLPLYLSKSEKELYTILSCLKESRVAETNLDAEFLGTMTSANGLQHHGQSDCTNMRQKWQAENGGVI